MTNEVVDTNQADRIRAELLALQKQIAPPSSNKIGTKGKVFTFPNGQSGPGPINVVILDFCAVNSFYEGVYNPNNKSTPACFAVGKELALLAPGQAAPKKQAASCAECPKNAWGSGNGGRGKACKNTRRLIVVPPDFTERTELSTLYVSPTGLKQWDNYIRRLALEFTSRPIDVITKIGFVASQAYPTLEFDFVEKVADIALAEKLRLRAADMLAREPEIPAQAA